MRGTFTPICNYQCVIDTKNAKPMAVKKIMYGLRETVILHRSIATLEKVGHICQIHNGQWLFKAAAKPHQVHVSNITDFVWRSCVNYIPVNQVMCQTAYPTPHCASAVILTLGNALYFWLFDAPMGNHQFSVSPKSQEKLAFPCTDTIKWTYTVMTFRPTNGPMTFIQMIHDLDSAWKDLAARTGLTVDNNTNTNIIVDDIFNWAIYFNNSLQYMECQLWICKAYCFTLIYINNYHHVYPCQLIPTYVDFHNAKIIPTLISHRNIPIYVPPQPMWEQHGVERFFNACRGITSNPATIIPGSLQSNLPSVKTTNNLSRYNNMYHTIQNMVLPPATAKHCFCGTAPTCLSVKKRYFFLKCFKFVGIDV